MVDVLDLLVQVEAREQKSPKQRLETIYGHVRDLVVDGGVLEGKRLIKDGAAGTNGKAVWTREKNFAGKGEVECWYVDDAKLDRPSEDTDPNFVRVVLEEDSEIRSIVVKKSESDEGCVEVKITMADNSTLEVSNDPKDLVRQDFYQRLTDVEELIRGNLTEKIEGLKDGEGEAGAGERLLPLRNNGHGGGGEDSVVDMGYGGTGESWQPADEDEYDGFVSKENWLAGEEPQQKEEAVVKMGRLVKRVRELILVDWNETFQKNVSTFERNNEVSVTSCFVNGAWVVEKVDGKGNLVELEVTYNKEKLLHLKPEGGGEKLVLAGLGKKADVEVDLERIKDDKDGEVLSEAFGRVEWLGKMVGESDLSKKEAMVIVETHIEEYGDPGKDWEKEALVDAAEKGSVELVREVAKMLKEKRNDDQLSYGSMVLDALDENRLEMLRFITREGNLRMVIGRGLYSKAQDAHAMRQFGMDLRGAEQPGKTICTNLNIDLVAERLEKNVDWGDLIAAEGQLVGEEFDQGSMVRQVQEEVDRRIALRPYAVRVAEKLKNVTLDAGLRHKVALLVLSDKLLQDKVGLGRFVVTVLGKGEEYDDQQVGFLRDLAVVVGGDGKYNTLKDVVESVTSGKRDR